MVLAVNKMDEVDWSEARYRQIEAEFHAMAGSFSFAETTIIPVAALTGDNVAYRSTTMPWYSGPTLLDYLESVDPETAPVDAPFRMPVQLVLRASETSAATPALSPRAGSASASASSMRDRALAQRSGASRPWTAIVPPPSRATP